MRIQRADFYQAFERAFAHLAQINALGKVVYIPERSALAGRNDQIHRVLTHILNRSQPKANGSLAVGTILNFEVVCAGIDIGGQHFNAHVAALGHVGGALVGIVFPGRKQSGHVFGGVVQFEVPGFHGNDAVVDRVAFVETVMGKSFPLGKDRFGCCFTDTAFNGALHKLFVVALDFFLFLLGDRRAEVIRFTR